MTVRLVAFPLIFLIFVFTARPGVARGTEVRETTVIVGMEPCCAAEAWPGAERLLAREFRALGFAVLIVPGKAQDERSRRVELQDLTEAHAAACAVRIVRPPAGQGVVELWVNDRVTGKMLFRQLEISPEVGDREAEIIALRIVEMLRASLLELRLPAPETGRRTPPPPKPRALPPAVRRLVPKEPPPPPPLLELEPQAGAWISSGGVPALGMLHLGLRLRLPAAIALTADLGLSAISGHLREEGLASTFDVLSGLVWATWQPEPRATVRPAFGVGAGLLRPSAEGISGDGFTLREDATWVAAAGVRFELSWHFGHRFAALFTVNAGVAIPEITVRFAGEAVAHAGNPFAEVLAGLRIHLF